uniref:helix-turn-helix domain-containing protein n=1 Tax=uncultured Draconibacterium sp. TaxID=1573823 RepID=UPI003216D70B
MRTNKQLELAYDFVQYTGQNIFLTGKAGTGKTTFLKSLKERSPKRMIVVAPTGVAAINAGGVTIHSFFQLSFAPQVGTEKELTGEQRFSKEKINIIRSLDLLVIDEISMVRADILDAIDRTLRRFKNRRKPFGGAQVLMIGDLQQLAPVIKNEEWGLLKREYDTAYFFSSKALKSFPYVSIELTEVFRQQDEDFISILNKVRENRLDETALAALNARYIPDFSPGDEEGFITLCTHNINAQRINDARLLELPGKKKTFKAEVQGKFPEYSYPTDFELVLKVGAQVMFVKNDSSPEKRFYNGKIGQVTSIENQVVYVQCPGEEEEIEVEAQVWENYKYSINKETGEIKEEIEGQFSQVPLKLAWAITIHKSQGLTFEKAIIDAEASFAHGQVYVALSRCKTLAGMVLSSPIGDRSIINDGTVSGFIRGVEENQPGEKELTEARLAFQKEQLTELFRFYRADYLLAAIAKIVGENKSSFHEVLVKHLEKMRNDFENEIVSVAAKFHYQIIELLKAEPNTEKNGQLQERVKKASAYFGEKVKSILVDGIKNVDLDIDNKTIKRQVKTRANELKQEAESKLAAYEVCVDGFNVQSIMDSRAKTLIAKGATKSGKQKAKEITSFDTIPHPELYNQLRAYRTEKCTELDIPPYMIFSQKVLFELIHYLPTDAANLKLINGLGKRKIEQFGVDIVTIIQHYCNDNNIEKGEIPLRDNAGKEKKEKVDTKKVSFDFFQSGKTIDEIAKERALTKNTIESHLAHYVKLGELDISQFLEEEKLKKITAYFEKAESKSFGEAKAHFGDEVDYGELRMGLSYLESLQKEK